LITAAEGYSVAGDIKAAADQKVAMRRNFVHGMLRRTVLMVCSAAITAPTATPKQIDEHFSCMHT
jgi:hypothetical protein